MSLTTSRIQFVSRNDRSIYATRNLLKSLGLKRNAAITLSAGPLQLHTVVRSVQKPGKVLYLPPAVRNGLRIPRAGACHLHYDNGRLRVGPMIGMLTTVSGSLSAPFGSRTPMIRTFLGTGTGRSYFYAFSPNDIDWSQNTVSAVMLGQGGGWIRRTVPLPDVVYNRLPSRKGDFSPTMENLKERLERRSIPVFNWSFFNKSDVYRLLDGEPESRYVPESHSNPQPDVIRNMLEKHQFVYIKPVGGSLGNGIYRLAFHPRRGYFCRYRRNGKNVLLRFSRFDSLVQMLNRGGKLRTAVAQQGIRLIELEDCPIDFRFHLNKNSRGAWVVSGVGAKKAGRGSVTTHIKNGGKLLTPDQALSRAFGSRADEVLERMKKVAVQLAEAIEKNYPHRLGELGFDLGIDRDEDIWMFEANAKPGRAIFKHPSLQSQGKDALDHIFGYCMYLSKFRARGDG